MIARSDKLEFPGDLKCKSILCVCWGNICRSPAAASILKREMKRMGIAGLHVESAGVSPEDQPQNPSLRMRWASFRRGIWLKSKQRLLTRKDLARFDLIIAMDREVLYSIHAIARGKIANVKLLSEFLSGDWPIDVPDPMRRSVSTCNRVLDMLHRACQEMVNTLGLPR
jgi:protein-tyrosine phosphatase